MKQTRDITLNLTDLEWVENDGVSGLIFQDMSNLELVFWTIHHPKVIYVKSPSGQECKFNFWNCHFNIKNEITDWNYESGSNAIYKGFLQIRNK